MDGHRKLRSRQSKSRKTWAQYGIDGDDDAARKKKQVCNGTLDPARDLRDLVRQIPSKVTLGGDYCRLSVEEAALTKVYQICTGTVLVLADLCRYARFARATVHQTW